MTVSTTVSRLSIYAGPWSLDARTRIAFGLVTLTGTYSAAKVDFIHEVGSTANLQEALGMKEVYQVIPMNTDWIAAPGSTFMDYDRSFVSSTQGRIRLYDRSNATPEYGVQNTAGLVFEVLIFGR